MTTPIPFVPASTPPAPVNATVQYLTNRKAFSEMIGLSEGTVTSNFTINDGYDVIVTGVDLVTGDLTPEVFTDYSAHPFQRGRPPKVINHTGLESTASGKHQILLHWWLPYQRLLRLPDFSKESQELYLLQQFKEHNALALIDGGWFDQAVIKITGLWASLPGKTYIGQHQNSLDHVRQLYVQAGGTLATTTPN